MGLKRTFSLIELAVAVMVLMLVSYGIAVIFRQGYMALGRSRVDSVAVSLARERMEELSYPAALPAVATTIEGYGSIADFPQYRRETVVTSHLTYPHTGHPAGQLELRRIDITVLWQIGARTGSRTVSTFRGNW